jgi:hypothetical protein
MVISRTAAGAAHADAAPIPRWRITSKQPENERQTGPAICQPLHHPHFQLITLAYRDGKHMPAGFSADLTRHGIGARLKRCGAPLLQQVE